MSTSCVLAAVYLRWLSLNDDHEKMYYKNKLTKLFLTALFQ